MKLLANENFPGEAVAALATRDDWAGHFTVIEDRRIRMTALPPEPRRE